MFDQVLLGVVGDLADHFVLAEVEIDVAGISYGDVEGFENDVGALVVDGAFQDGVDGVHDGGRMASALSIRATGWICESTRVSTPLIMRVWK